MFPAPLDLGSALSFDLGCLLALGFLALTLRRDRLADRILFGSVLAGLILPYVVWRLTETLPAFEWEAEAIWPRIFMALESVSVVYTLGMIVVMLRSSEAAVLREADEAEAAINRSGCWPAVDVLICTYDERLSVLEKSILAARELDYPSQVTIYVLDDKRRSSIRQYCDEVGVEYVTRPNNDHAKAGNLNNALRVTAGLTNAPLILVLDADFAPQRNLLRRLVGMFRDPEIGLVQTPQFYFNSDAVQHNLHISRSWVDDQRVFFDVLQPAMDAWGCAFCVGTSYVVRRDALGEIGGVREGTVAEDLLLSLKLHTLGWKTRWLNQRLSIGLSADGIVDYANQRMRWCLGCIQIALLPDGPLRGPGYGIRHRLCFGLLVLYWFGKFHLVALLFAPTLYWLFDLPVYHADYLQFLRYGLPPVIAYWIWSVWNSGGRALPMLTEITHAVVSIPVCLTIISALRRPFGRAFKVTPKGVARDRLVVEWRLARPFLVIMALTSVCIARFLFGPDSLRELSAADSLNLVWASVAMFLCLACFLVCCDRPQAQEDRFPVRRRTTARWTGGEGGELPCEVLSMSERGATMQIAGSGAGPGAVMEIMLPETGWLPARVVAADAADRLELVFDASPAQHRALVGTLYSWAPQNMPHSGNLLGALRGVSRRFMAP